jgi:predicted short-subunit dehydrogenase-like oxidoreductase (DUF2520 family)
MKAGIYGSGNLAWHLTRWLSQKHIPITGISGRNAENCRKIWPDYITPRELALRSDVIFLAVPDAAIAESAALFARTAAIVVHCSGATAMNKLSLCPHHGVFWPLQSFTREMYMQYDHIHVFVEAGNAATQKKLLFLGNLLTDNAHITTEDERRLMHLAAVFSSNFVNHMLYIASVVSGKQGPGLVALQPLIEETINKAMLLGPLDAQTGPARRGDNETIANHLKMLESNPEWQALYKSISGSIAHTYGKLQGDSEED